MPFNSLEAEGEQLRRKKENTKMKPCKSTRRTRRVSLFPTLLLCAWVYVSVGQTEKRICHRTRFITKVVSFVTYFISFLGCCITEKRTEQKSDLKFTFRTFFRTCFSSTHLRAIIKLENNEVPTEIMITNYRLQVLHTSLRNIFWFY